MSLVELQCYLYASSDTVFSKLETTGSFDQITAFFTGFIRWVCMWIVRGIGTIVDAMETFVDYCYQFLSFGNSKNVTGLMDILVKYSWIPIMICFIIIAFKFISGTSNKGDGKRFITNVVLMLVALIVLPSVFTTIDRYIFDTDESVTDGGGFLTHIADGSSETSVTNTIINAYTIDYYNLYNDVIKSNVDEENGTTTYNSTDELKIDIKNKVKEYHENTNSVDYVNSNAFDVNEEIKPANIDGAKVPALFKYKVTVKDNAIDDAVSLGLGLYTRLYGLVPMHQDGFFGIDVGNQYYYRYNIDFTCVIISLLATIIMYLCIGFSVIKISTELIIHRVFTPMMSTLDLNGGDRIKKYLTSILGCYVALFISAITIKLYGLAVSYVAGFTSDVPLVGALINLCLAFVFLDIPNMIAKYFGVNTGVRGFMAATALAMRSAMRTPGRVAGRFRDETRYAKQQARYANQENQRQADRAEQNRRYQENQQRQAEREQRQADLEQQKASNWEAQYGDHMNAETNDFSTVNVDQDKNPEDQKNNVLGNAALMQADTETQYDINSPINDDTQQVKNVLSMNYPNMSDEDKNAVAQEINSDRGMRNTSNQMYDNIGQAAESKINEGSLVGKQAYDNAAREYMESKDKQFANNENRERTASYMGAVAYTNANQKSIRQQAKEYQLENKGMSDKDAVIHTITSSDKGYVKGLSDAQINNVAERMLKNGSLSMGDYRDFKPAQNSFTRNLTGKSF